MVSLIAAVGRNGVIGLQDSQGQNTLPWYGLKDDMKHFVQTTTGHQMIMGAATLLSFPEPLKKRQHRVLTHNSQELYEAIQRHKQAAKFLDAINDRQIVFCHNLEEALDCELPIITGGASVYGRYIDRGVIDTYYITHVHQDFENQPEGTKIIRMPEIPYHTLEPLKGFIPKHVPKTIRNPAYTIMAYERT